MQQSEAGFEGLLRGLLSQQYLIPLAAICEEYHENLGPSIAQRLAGEYQLKWFNLDLTIAEKQELGILTDQLNRPGMFQETVAYRVSSDTIREEEWAVKLAKVGAFGTTLAVCGYLHFEPLVELLRAKGHSLDKRVYLETVPKIVPAGASGSPTTAL
jgi:hypothetical protein